MFSGETSVVFFDAECLGPEDSETTLNNTTKIIDFALVSREIKHLFKVKLNPRTSFSPHFSLLIEIMAQPASIQGQVIKTPKVLPIKEAIEKWESLNQYQQLRHWRRAQNLASIKLSYAYNKTGYAILGKPTEAIFSDPTYCGDLLDCAVRVGEQMAAAALSAEFLICRLAGVEVCERRAYLGRSQFPSFIYPDLQ